ncbi:hypothetical protein MJG53_018834 [Ovis ammon polii x Ovis aries]|uniref:Uncharacterized protein n=1 Tax=Ovis ammon polii x Ovis aries TaxID=2918886 RepID=A0ACB9U3F3_9CETA|nr:hypothetical protein MJG53_018834 [Ovis ammon polii x Ovis aries]
MGKETEAFYMHAVSAIFTRGLSLSNEVHPHPPADSQEGCGFVGGCPAPTQQRPAFCAVHGVYVVACCADYSLCTPLDCALAPEPVVCAKSLLCAVRALLPNRNGVLPVNQERMLPARPGSGAVRHRGTGGAPTWVLAPTVLSDGFHWAKGTVCEDSVPSEDTALNSFAGTLQLTEHDLPHMHSACGTEGLVVIQVFLPDT